MTQARNEWMHHHSREGTHCGYGILPLDEDFLAFLQNQENRRWDLATLVYQGSQDRRSRSLWNNQHTSWFLDNE